MHLDDRHVDRRHRVAQRDRVVREGAGVEDHAGEPRRARALQPIHQLPLVIRLTAFDAHAASAAPRECPPASMMDAIVKPSGSLCSMTARKRTAPSDALTMKPAAIATPSNTVCTPRPKTASQPADGRNRASRCTSSPKWKCGATVCSNRWTPK